MGERLGYYPGCSLHTSAREYDLSCRAVLKALGVDYAEIPDWNCCGASSAHGVGHALSRALPLRNLMIAEDVGEDLIVPCAACYSILRSTTGYLQKKSAEARELQAKVEQVLGKPYREKVQVTHPLDLLTRPEMLNKIKGQLRTSLNGIKLAPYYGCFLVRPEIAAFDNQEQPQKMDILLRELGAEVVRWSYKTECCGGGVGITEGSVASSLVEKLVCEARKAGAEAVVTACPLCQANLEGRQTQGLPAFYFTELVGLALGISASKRWFKSHLVDTTSVLTKVQGGISGGR